MQIAFTKIAGIVLAAGESSRMGRHKALIQIDDNTTLLEHQTTLLLGAGCTKVVVVVGCDAEVIIGAHDDLDVQWAVNDDWESGQFSSTQRGITEALKDDIVGMLILPIDAAGISPDTVAAIIESALHNPHLDSIKPEFEGGGGHPIFISRTFAESLLRLDPADSESRLDVQTAKSKHTLRIPVADANIIANANTPKDL